MKSYKQNSPLTVDQRPVDIRYPNHRSRFESSLWGLHRCLGVTALYINCITVDPRFGSALMSKRDGSCRLRLRITRRSNCRRGRRRKEDVDVVLLEQAHEVGSAGRGRWNKLRQDQGWHVILMMAAIDIAADTALRGPRGVASSLPQRGFHPASSASAKCSRSVQPGPCEASFPPPSPPLTQLAKVHLMNHPLQLKNDSRPPNFRSDKQ